VAVVAWSVAVAADIAASAALAVDIPAWLVAVVADVAASAALVVDKAA